MHDFVNAALDAARLAGASYADARVVHEREERISVRSGRVDALESSESLGIGVRVISEGAWGFAATRELDPDSIAACARQAVAIARASTLTSHAPVLLSDVGVFRDTWSGTCEIDPFTIPLEDKLALLLSADEALRVPKEVAVSTAHLGFLSVTKLFASTEGSVIEQSYTESSGGIVAFALGDGEMLPRSYPNSHGGQAVQGGWEAILALDLAGHAPRVAQEAAALVSAIPCPSTETTVIIDGSQLGLQVHESVGHPTELDRVLGDEAAFAGTSFVRVEDIDALQY
ncbi:MAG: TldD/PmbA family protein, partial [Coriobacteriia bacterium]